MGRWGGGEVVRVLFSMWGFTDLYVMGVVAKLFIIVQCLFFLFNSLYSMRWYWLF